MERYAIYLIVLALIYSIYGLAYNITFGYTGIVSFGHGVLFGIPAYSVAILSKILNRTDVLSLIAVPLMIGVLLGLMIGYCCTFTRGIYTALITIVIPEIFYKLIISNPGGLTNGENGITGFRPSPFEVSGISLDLFDWRVFYYLTLSIFLACLWIIKILADSNFGAVLKGIRENEERVKALGYNTRMYKVLAFCISGFFSGVAGTLYALHENVVVPWLVHWLTTGSEVLLINMLGGPATLMGPILGSWVYIFAKYYISSWIGGANWIFFLGGLYIVVILILRGGIWNYVSQVLRRHA
jgi:branched-chain amino acid transport system permease protein